MTDPSHLHSRAYCRSPIECADNIARGLAVALAIAEYRADVATHKTWCHACGQPPLGCRDTTLRRFAEEDREAWKAHAEAAEAALASSRADAELGRAVREAIGPRKLDTAKVGADVRRAIAAALRKEPSRDAG